MDLALKPWVSLHEEVVYPVGFFKDDFGNLFSIGTLVEQNVERKIRYE